MILELRNFMDEKGRLKSWPAKRKLKLVAIQYLATKFQEGVESLAKCQRATIQNKYSNMDRSLSGQTSIFGGVFFVFKSLLGIERQKKL